MVTLCSTVPEVFFISPFIQCGVGEMEQKKCLPVIFHTHELEIIVPDNNQTSLLQKYEVGGRS